MRHLSLSSLYYFHKYILIKKTNFTLVSNVGFGLSKFNLLQGANCI